MEIGTAGGTSFAKSSMALASFLNGKPPISMLAAFLFHQSLSQEAGGPGGTLGGNRVRHTRQ